jgi:hypothetical protein
MDANQLMRTPNVRARKKADVKRRPSTSGSTTPKLDTAASAHCWWMCHHDSVVWVVEQLWIVGGGFSRERR